MQVEQALPVGSLVWAKLRSFPWWPAKIVTPRADLPPPAAAATSAHAFVSFLGQPSVAWVGAQQLALFSDRRDLCDAKLPKASQRPAYALAVKEATAEHEAALAQAAVVAASKPPSATGTSPSSSSPRPASSSASRRSPRISAHGIPWLSACAREVSRTPRQYSTFVVPCAAAAESIATATATMLRRMSSANKKHIERHRCYLPFLRAFARATWLNARKCSE